MLAPDLSSALPRLIIAGGGVAALEALVALHELAPGRFDVLLVSPSDKFAYRPLQVVEPFGFADGRRYPIDILCRDLGARFVHSSLLSVDHGAREVELVDRTRLGYDVLLVAVGAKAYPAFEDGVTFDRESLPEDFDEVLSASDEGLAEKIAIVVPSGATWSLPAYELALLTAARAPRGEVTLVTHEPDPLCVFGERASAGVRAILDAAGVALHTGERPSVVSATALRVGWDWIEASRVVSLPLLSGRAIGGIPHDERGFVSVDPHGCVPGLEGVYAAGDGTTQDVKQGGLAAQQADAVARHIAARDGATSPPDVARLVLRGLLLTREGPRYLRAELDDLDNTSTISEEPLWWPPSKIASRWLSPHLEHLDALQLSGRIAPAAPAR